MKFKCNDSHDLDYRINYFSDVSNFHTHYDISESTIYFPPFEKIPVRLPKPSPLNTSFLPLVSNLSAFESFKFHPNSSFHNLEYYFLDDKHVMKPLFHPFDTHKILQLQNSSVGKLDNFMVSYTVSLVKVVIIGWFPYHWL